MLVGFPCYLMSPVSFLRRPIRWLRAITNFGGTHSAAPNFAYELCVRKTNAEEWRSLDLRSWRVASNGAEPIRASTLDEFAAAFASSGFRGERFCPSYGLAEATLKVSTTRTGIPPRVLDADVEELERGRFVAADVSQPARRIVGCGTSTIGAVIAIVDPQTLSERGACEIGEIWVSSPSVALGYWRRPEQTEQTFHAHTADGRGPFLRTGDLGFLLDGELFVTGRLKDLIILRGRNHYPHDIESTAERAHPAVRPGCSTAFLVSDGSGGEVLALLVEIQTERAAEAAEVLRNVRASISRDHRIAVEHLAIYPAGTLPKTSSGKVRRAASRELFLSGATPTIAEWHRAS
jgi:acyl-CoA synthetase (AMP-forming)/AMP-acid ligase II